MDNQSSMLSKTLIIGIILLFINISISPSTGTILKKISIKPIYNGNTLYVGGTGEGNYTSIQDAIDDASDGDTIRVYNGLYNEVVEVNKRLNLIGNGPMGTIIDGGFPDHKHVVYITANGVNMSGFGVKNSYMGHEFGGIGVQSFNNKIFNNFCWNNLYGVILFCDNNKLYNNSFSNNKRNGIWVKSSGNNIYNNHCLNSSEKDGIWLYICTDNILSNNICSYNYMNGIALYQSHNNYVFNNTCIGNKFYNGILIYESTNNEFSNNNFSYNNDDGIGVYHFSDYNMFTNNFIAGNQIGVNIKDNCSFNNAIYNNIVSNYDRGISLDSSSNNNIIYHNNFKENTPNAYDGCNNIWNDSYPLGGNYWDDYFGEDVDNDGIGDKPYYIVIESQDSYPLMKPWGKNLPNADFSYLTENLTVFFNASLSYDRDGKIISYKWEFGDGNIGAGMSVCHTYSTNGTYNVNLSVKDDDGYNDKITKIIIAEGNQPPDLPNIDGQKSGKSGKEYEYTFNTTDPNSDDVRYLIDWGDNTSNTTGYNPSSKDVKVKHMWSNDGTYNISVKAQDIYGLEGPEGTLTVTMPSNKPLNFNLNLLERLLGRFSNSFPIIRLALKFKSFYILYNLNRLKSVNTIRALEELKLC